MAEDIILSFTSHGNRLAFVHHVLKNVVKIPFKKICLTIYKDDLLLLNKNKEAMNIIRRNNVEILTAQLNLKNHLKYYYTMLKYPYEVIMIIDDDMEYSQYFFDSLFKLFHQHPYCCCGHRGFFIYNYDETLPFTVSMVLNKEVYAVVEGVNGVIFPKGFGSDIEQYLEIIQSDECILKNDDLFLGWLKIAKGVKSIVDRQRKDTVDLGRNLQTSRIEPSYAINYVRNGLSKRCVELLFTDYLFMKYLMKRNYNWRPVNLLSDEISDNMLSISNTDVINIDSGPNDIANLGNDYKNNTCEYTIYVNNKHVMRELISYHQQYGISKKYVIARDRNGNIVGAIINKRV